MEVIMQQIKKNTKKQKTISPKNKKEFLPMFSVVSGLDANPFSCRSCKCHAES